MSKGRRPKKGNRPNVTTRDVGDGNGGGGDVEEPEDNCWDFPLTEKTAAANTVKEGTAAIGSIQSRLVLVRANTKPLGYAPPDYSQRMITAARARGARLSGSVISTGKKD
ncbi:MAG: hypothetical protein M3362_00845 [Acidobacteriota bacterium]|nr:hypothetical protein [Acidobacteriota bacterium]